MYCMCVLLLNPLPFLPDDNDDDDDEDDDDDKEDNNDNDASPLQHCLLQLDITHLNTMIPAGLHYAH